MEGVNARRLTPADLPSAMDLVTIDVSFISLRLILTAVVPLLAPGAAKWAGAWCAIRRSTPGCSTRLPRRQPR